MSYRAAWYTFAVLAIVVILFELFFRFRYEAAGNRLWRIDRLTEHACLVRIGNAVCSPGDLRTLVRTGRSSPRNPYLQSPTPEPNLPY
jgi:hypothetical protein